MQQRSKCTYLNYHSCYISLRVMIKRFHILSDSAAADGLRWILLMVTPNQLYHLKALAMKNSCQPTKLDRHQENVRPSTAELVASISSHRNSMGEVDRNHYTIKLSNNHCKSLVIKLIHLSDEVLFVRTKTFIKNRWEIIRIS